MRVNEAWHDRLGWAFDLIADDVSTRRRAHSRLLDTRLRCSEAQRRFNEVLRRPNHPKHAGRLAAYLRARDNTLPDALWDDVKPKTLAAWGGLPCALLYLRWEALFPDEWFEHAKSWGTKQSLLSLFTRGSDYVPETVADQLIDLVTMAVRREHRCEDVGYARLARALDRPKLRMSLASVSDLPTEPARSRARYLLWLLDHPGAPQPKKNQWLAWLGAQSGRHVGT